MENQNLIRPINKTETYYDVRVKCSELSKDLNTKVSIKDFLTLAANQLLNDTDLLNKIKKFKKEVLNAGNNASEKRNNN